MQQEVDHQLQHPATDHPLQHPATPNEVTLGRHPAYIVIKQGMLQLLALHGFQPLDMCSLMEWTNRMVLLMNFYFLQFINEIPNKTIFIFWSN